MRFRFLAAAAFALALAHPAAAEDQPYYAGKKISVVVGFAAGGGIDTMARMFVSHFARHIEGSPQLIVQNMPGAAGLIAMNRLANISAKDGLTIAYDTWGPLNQVIQSKFMKFDYNNMTMAGAFKGGPYVMFARKDVAPGGMQRPADIAKAKNLIYAGQQPTLVLDIHGRVALDLLKLKYKYISGYKGPPSIRNAMEQNEANITTHGLQGYRAGVAPRFVKQGLFVPLWYFPGRDADGKWLRDDRMTDMPPLLDVYKDIYGKSPEGFDLQIMELLADLHGHASEFVWAPPGTDARATEALRKAFYKAAVDPAFYADQDKILGFRYRAVPIPEAQAIARKLSNVDPKLRAYVQKLMQ